MIWSWSGLFKNTHNHFPGHPVNVLDCFSCDTILFWTIYDPVNNVLDHSWNVLWKSWAGSTMIWSWSGVFMNSHKPWCQCPGPFLKCAVNVLGRFSHDIWSWSRLFMDSYNHFPDHPVNVLDCFSYDTILSWTIVEMCCECPGQIFPSCDFSPDHLMCASGLLLIWYYLDPEYNCMIDFIWNYYHWWW